jgi:hypothetical protein
LEVRRKKFSYVQVAALGIEGKLPQVHWAFRPNCQPLK